VQSTFPFPRSFHVPGPGDATRPRQGEVCGGGDDFCASDSDTHVWVCDFDPDAQTCAGVTTIRGRVLSVLPDLLGSGDDEVPVFGLGCEVK